MRRIVIAFVSATAALVAAVAVFVGLTLPPRAERPAAAGDESRLAWGAYHVHSSRSDGSGSVDEIAAAAARAGLDFVVFADHGDASGDFEAPAYRHGVLCLDAVEVGTDSGHVVALNLRAPSAYPLGGAARDVVEDIRRLGGWAVAAHPDSPRANLRWRGGPTDGLEWLNVDSEWRSHPATTMLAAATRAIVRPAESIASLFQPPTQSLRRWDAALRNGAAFSVAAVDAHARLATEDNDITRGASVRFPGYESIFRTVAQVVVLDRPLSNDAAADAAAVLGSIGGGRSYSVVRAYVDAVPAIGFTATYSSGAAAIGGMVPAGEAATLRAESPVMPGARLVLYRDGREVAGGEGRLQLAAPAEAAAYRVEAFLPGRAFPWVVTNAIRFAAPEPPGRPVNPADDVRPGQAEPAPVVVAVEGWSIEKDPTSSADLTPEGDGVRLRYRLGPGGPAGQYVAVAVPVPQTLALERIDLAAKSPRPMRLSIQVRVPGGADGQRWRRSLYVDQKTPPVSVRLAELDPIDQRSPLRPIVARVQTVLFVVDTVNARPGAGGEVVLQGVRLVPGTTPEAPASRRP